MNPGHPATAPPIVPLPAPEWTEHLEILDRVLASEDILPERRGKWGHALGQIRSRLRDPALYVAVIGEFSSGKSTAINALIHQHLLPADVLPATTAAATLVRYAPDLRIEVDYQDGSSEVFAKPPSVDALLSRFIATEQVARKVARVTVYCPAPVLRQGLVAVDTPGLNVENPRHIELTAWALRELCDAAIVAIPANIPVADTLVEFLLGHLRDSLARCLFVATKIDLILAEDRPRLLRTIAARLEAKLGLERPLVIPLSAAAALGEALADGTDASSPGLAGSQYRALQDQFTDAERTISQTLAAQRSSILLERTADLVTAVYAGLEADLRAAKSRYQADHQALERNRLPNLEAYTRESRERHGRTLEMRLTPLRGRAGHLAGSIRQATLQEIDHTLAGAASEDALRGAVRQSVPQSLAGAREKLHQGLLAIVKQMDEATAQQLELFEKEFGAAYRALETLGGRIAPGDGAAHEPIATGGLGAPAPHSASLLATVKQDQTIENAVMQTGVWGGAVAGQLLIPVPGLGFLIGLVAGGILGALLTPSLPQLREKYRPAVQATTKDYFDQLETSAQALLDEAAAAERARLDRVVGDHASRYRALVRRMVERDQRLADGLASAQRCIRNNLNQLNLGRQQLARLQAPRPSHQA